MSLRTLAVPLAQTLHHILVHAVARGLQNLHRARVLAVIAKDLAIFEAAHKGIIEQFALRGPDGQPIQKDGGVAVSDPQAYTAAMDQLIAAQPVTFDTGAAPELAQGLAWAATVLSSDACPELTGSHALRFGELHAWLTAA